MGVSLMKTLELKCELHGEYQKYITDADKACPHCRSEMAQKQQDQYIENTKPLNGLFLDLTIACDVHGPQIVQVPKFLADKLSHCPKCVQAKREQKLQKKIEKRASEIIEQAGIPLNSIGHTFSQADRSKSIKQTAIIERLITYIQDITARGDSTGAKNIMLSGNMGTGKTYFASILLQNIIVRACEKALSDESNIRFKGGLAIQFISEQALQSAITATWSDKSETTKQLYERLSSKAILCIDDVGTVSSTQTHLLDAYAAILDERYKRNLPTIITSNMTHEGLKLAIGARAADRFLEKNRVIVANFDWHGYRTAQEGTNEIEFF